MKKIKIAILLLTIISCTPKITYEKNKSKITKNDSNKKYNFSYTKHNKNSIHIDTKYIIENKEIDLSKIEKPLIVLNTQIEEKPIYLNIYSKKVDTSKLKIQKPISIVAVGDIILQRGIEKLIEQNKIEEIFSDTLPILKQADYTIGNLETTITEKTQRANKTFTFKAKPNSLKALKQAGFDYLSITNNHCYDYKEEGFKDTLKNIKNQNFDTSGAGTNIEEATKILQKKIQNQKINIISYGAFPVERSGFNGEKTATATKKRAGILWFNEKNSKLLNKKDPKEINIAIFHGGTEYQNYPSNYTKKIAHQMIDQGADIVIGSHPHVLQKVETYKNHLIFYSLGNFIFPKMDIYAHLGSTTTMISKIIIYQNQVKLAILYPCKIENTKTSLSEDDSYIKKFVLK